ncbi:Peptide/nickel transport system substrate-binding protein [Bosea sp. 62]|uniref:ABC transporter substrate-binding protein n=1 Tax=unclassified Bosea (in: a-proteobacteria) TaxID=2653178 RepID=UPI001251F077|nr:MULTISPECIES: ABC transporter substrate-binding protein [unclassified Bosea (in: a-proteobacteria)]CAD5290758.1 Peptide/nickel transport system substrate-binding protein [Bosea sp. 7B]CAD5300004.1 Peptide/nickel transport system substrate-binding protein [Bosea sp. 21B]CAD5300527.1 Peptide/nickel transport system substrate-binding protein [Bosea sp. 46]VVT61823.1 Peptide/nickel transport system substrate-binding protein [Bosea sp. EC-HK365B]VXB42678.1 Peptide/nickel transport system substra
MKRIVLLASAALLGLAALPAQAQSPSTLRIGLQEDPDMLDPHKARTFVGRIVFMGLCDRLVDIDPELKITPRLATEWSFSGDGLTLTMKLRTDAKFHDGETFNAEAAKANIERAMTLPDSLRKSELASVESVSAPDPATLVFKLKRPDATLLAQLTDRAGMMLSPKSLGPDITAKPICSGPYQFVERVQNDRIVLEKFKGHWEADKYQFDRIIYRAIPDTTVRLANLRAGELDMLERLAPTDVKSAQGDKNLKVQSTANLGYQGITINTNHTDAANQPMGKDKRVRQALSLSIDRKVLSQVVFEGLYAPMNQPFNPGNQYLSAALPVPERDVAKAKALLKEAGVAKVSVELFVTNNPVDAQLGQVIQAMAQEAGIDIQIRSSEFASQLRDQQQGKFQMSRIGWSGRIDPDGNIHPFVTSKGNQNDGKYSNAEVDRLLDEARTIYDVAERKKRYDAAQKILQDELPIVYLYNQTVFFALRSNIQGFVINPDGMIRLSGLKRS